MAKLPKGQFYLGRDSLGFILGVAPLGYDESDHTFGSLTQSLGICAPIIKRLVRGQTRIPKGRQAIVKITVRVLELLPKE